jgi:predicted DCC family thiol-disulfide oxidoreductase YuxK
VTGDHRLGRDGSRLTVLYDRDCGICGLTAAALRRWDRNGQFELVPLQVAEAGGDPRLADVAGRYLLADELHVVAERGEVASGGDAALAIIDALPGGWVLRPWAMLPPFRTLTRIGYRLVARNRGALGRWLGLELACEAPSISTASRRDDQKLRRGGSNSSVNGARRSTRNASLR